MVTGARETEPKVQAPSHIRTLLSDGDYLRIWTVGGLTGVVRWLEMLATGIFAYETTGSPALVALIPLLRLAPMAICGTAMGAVADRLDRRVVFKAGILLSWGTMLVMLGLAWFDAIAYWHVAVASAIGGIFWTMDMPVRRRIVGDISGPSRLVTAMSLDSATNNATRAIGPLAGGLVYESLGLTGVYALTSVGFVIAFFLTSGIRTRGDMLESDGPGWRDWRGPPAVRYRSIGGRPVRGPGSARALGAGGNGGLQHLGLPGHVDAAGAGNGWRWTPPRSASWPLPKG